MATMRVISLDPGITTGYGMAAIEDSTICHLAYGQEKWEVDQLWDFMAKTHPDVIIMEDFTYRRHQKHAELFSVQLIGVTRLYCLRTDTPFYKQKPAYAKNDLWTDEKFKELEIYQKGLEHGRDAVRHFLQWFSFGGGYKYNQDQKLNLVPMRWIQEAYFQMYP